MTKVSLFGQVFDDENVHQVIRQGSSYSAYRNNVENM